MDAFAPVPPAWTEQATHAPEFCCPTCRASSLEATQVWINRRSPVHTLQAGYADGFAQLSKSVS